MKILIVAHPDDEILWFNPLSFDLIVMVFCDRDDKKELSAARKAAISQLPYHEKIQMLDLVEPGIWKDKSRVSEYNFAKNGLINALILIKKQHAISSVYTHNSAGEYGHLDHMLVHDVVVNVFSECCEILTPNIFLNQNENEIFYTNDRVEKNNIESFISVREIYLNKGAWTWNLTYIPNETQSYTIIHAGVSHER